MKVTLFALSAENGQMTLAVGATLAVAQPHPAYIMPSHYGHVRLARLASHGLILPYMVCHGTITIIQESCQI